MVSIKSKHRFTSSIVDIQLFEQNINLALDMFNACFISSKNNKF